MKRTIFTITCHNVYNAGASLQAFALQSYLKQMGHQVEIIDYMPEYLRHYVLFRMNPKFDKNIFTRSVYYFIKVPRRLLKLLDRRKTNYDRFTKKYLQTTTKRFSSNDELKKEALKGDVFIAGSDQIWNPILDNGKDPAFFLDFVPEGIKKISYAGSFSVEKIPAEVMIKMRSWLSRFDCISVREESALKILQQMNLQGEVVVDPVFLLGTEAWDSICSSRFSEKFILVYDFDNDPNLKNFAEKLATEHKLKIYSVLKCKWADVRSNFWAQMDLLP